jgi:hypothetical protein
LEALKYQVTLLVLELPDLVIGLHVVVVEGLAQVVARDVLRVEHVRAQVHNSTLVDLIVLIVVNRLSRVLFDELGDSV